MNMLEKIVEKLDTKRENVQLKLDQIRGNIETKLEYVRRDEFCKGIVEVRVYTYNKRTAVKQYLHSVYCKTIPNVVYK